MSHYIDGFAFPIARNRIGEYKPLAEAVAEIWKEHGALAYYEYSGDDMTLEGTRSFPDLLSASEDETIVFGWVAFESREARDAANAKVAVDPRMEELFASANSASMPKEWRMVGLRHSFKLPSDAPYNMKLNLTKEPVTRLACATRAPEPLGSLTWC
jgi:uncharacterized protein YbaA (DUF1428 family)